MIYFTDISETPGASIMACLCDNDLCNSHEEGSSNNQPVAFPLIADPPTQSSSNSRRDPPNLPPPEEDFSDDELNDLLALSKFNQVRCQKNFTLVNIRLTYISEYCNVNF